jgi:hypothetical protein
MRESAFVLDMDLMDAFTAPFDFSPALDLLLLIGNKKTLRSLPVSRIHLNGLQALLTIFVTKQG